jgi:hypothetical protein
MQLVPSAALRTGAHDEVWPEVKVVGEAANGREAVDQVAECRPDREGYPAYQKQMAGDQSRHVDPLPYFSG